MRGINKSIIVGTLGQDPDIRYTNDGEPVANMSVATSEEWKDKNTGEKKQNTEWHRIVVFDRLAEICGKYLKKGSQVYFEGKLKTRKWQDQSGNDRYTTEIVAKEMQILGGRAEATDSLGGDDGQQGGGTPQAAQKPAMENFEDDIPFS